MRRWNALPTLLLKSWPSGWRKKSEIDLTFEVQFTENRGDKNPSTNVQLCFQRNALRTPEVSGEAQRRPVRVAEGIQSRQQPSLRSNRDPATRRPTQVGSHLRSVKDFSPEMLLLLLVTLLLSLTTLCLLQCFTDAC